MNRLLATASLLFAVGCAHTPDIKTAANGARAGAGAGGATGQDPSAITVTDGSADGNADGSKGALDGRSGECAAARVHFGFNDTSFDPADRALLDKSAECLKSAQGVRVTIEGNADERGTEEYNLALGDKRAEAVATYLRSLGVSAAQLRTVSYGKNNPVCTTHDEGCWAQNRQAAVNPTLASAGAPPTPR